MNDANLRGTTVAPELEWHSNPMLRNVSKRIVQPMIRYLDAEFGTTITNQIIAESDHDRDFFEDVYGFMPIETTEKMFASAIRITDNPDFAYKMGKEIWKYTPTIQALLGITVATPSLLFENMNNIEGKAVRTTIVDTQKFGASKYRLSISFRGGFVEPANACRNRHGTYESATQMFGLPPSKVEHPQCRFRGDDHCVYDITVPEQSFFIYQKISFIIGFLGLVGFGLFALLHSPILAIVGSLCIPLALGSYLFFLRSRLTANLRWIANAKHSIEENSKDVLTEMNRTKHLHELTSNLNSCLSPLSVAKAATHSLTHDFNYGSGQVWLLKDDDSLMCTATSGLAQNLEASVKSISYSISEGMNRPESFIAHVIGRKEILLINDVKTSTQTFIAPTQDLLQLINPSSFIIVPILEKNKAVGMIIGANHEAGVQVKYLDRVIFEALTLVVSTTLAKAKVFESMERKLEKRKQLLRDRQDELLIARKISIQNEKVSALGEMAAGVAHEINNPLNFLVNIVSELERDTKGLHEIAALGNTFAPQNIRHEIDKIFVDYNLAERITESDYVYTLIRQSLARAQKTVSSLRIFARQAGNDGVKPEPLCELIRSAFEIIPQKYRADVTLTCELGSECAVHVNRIEFSQIIINILTNSIEAMNGKGSIKIDLEETNRSHLVSISDTGCGVPPENRALIFKAFFTTQNKEQHTGLGLTVALELSHKNGGTIELAQKQPTLGACFIITIPKPFKPSAELDAHAA